MYLQIVKDFNKKLLLNVEYIGKMKTVALKS
jgi:hypothetical protein